MKTMTNDGREIIKMAGHEWVRVPHTTDGLEQIDATGAPTVITESSLRRLEQERTAAAEKLAVGRAERVRRDAEFAALPRVVIDGVEWARSAADPDVLISTDVVPAVYREATVRQWATERANRAQLAEARNAPTPVEQRITELEAQLAALRASA